MIMLPVDDDWRNQASLLFDLQTLFRVLPFLTSPRHLSSKLPCLFFLAEGLEVEIVSAGGTNTYGIVSNIEGITELQAGSYVFMDGEHDVEGVRENFGHSLTVLSTVTSRPRNNWAIIDAGMKCFADSTMPKAKHGSVKEVAYLSEEHGWLEMEEGVELSIGDRLEFYPNYAPFTVNAYDKFVRV
jgi:D-serine deaminase-like pyridoxal phosphate-dependent protein